MGRLLLILLALATPFIVYGLWTWIERKRQSVRSEGRMEGWESLPWAWLIIAGVVLVALSLISMRVFDWDPDALIGGPSLIQRDAPQN